MKERKIAEDTRVVVSRGEFVMLPRGYTVSETWNVVDTDNFGGDYPNERFVAWRFASEQEASVYADTVNKRAGEHSLRFLKVVKHIEIAYVLQPGFES